MEGKAYLAGFTWDIFVSYGRVDDDPLEGGEGWVTLLRLALENELSKEGKPVRVFQDESAQHNGDLDDVIQQALSSSALFVAVVTPHYCGSQWCKDELSWFQESSARADSHSAIKNQRLFKVRARYVELYEEPEPLRGSVGYDFVGWDKKNAYHYQLPLKDLDNQNNKATIEFRKLVRDLNERLEQLAKPTPIGEANSGHAGSRAPADQDGDATSGDPTVIEPKVAERRRPPRPARPPMASLGGVGCDRVDTSRLQVLAAACICGHQRFVRYSVDGEYRNRSAELELSIFLALGKDRYVR